MSDQLHLDIIMANTGYFRSISEMWEMWVRRGLDQYAQELDFQYNFTLGTDSLIFLPEAVKELPKNALIYTHSNMTDNHSNLSHLGRLVEKRPDLRVMVNITPSRTFKDQRVREVFQELMERPLSPKYPLSQLFFSDSPKDFFAYSSPEEGGSYFQKYLVEYLQMRRGK